jgi:predicted metal-dependent peptidase
MTANDLMSLAVNGLMKSNPFYAIMLLKHKMIWDEAQATGYTDGVTLGTNTKWFSALTKGQRITYLAHEVLHVCLMHHTRRYGRDNKQWNIACDYVINLVLVDAGFEPLPKWLYDTKYKGMSAEQVYRLLQQKGNKQQPKPQQQQQSGSGNSKQGNGQPTPSNTEPDTIGEVRDAPNPQDAEQKTAQSIKQAQSVAKRMGKMGNATERAVNNISQGGDPRDILAAFLTDRARTEYTYTKPARRYIVHDMYEPSMYNKALGRFAISCDTSGSISGAEIQKLVAFVFSVLATLSDYKSQTSLPVIYCDDTVRRVEELEDGMKANPIGGGGTDFAPPFKYIDESGEDIVGMIYITDGYGSFPQIQPDYPVVWALLCPHYNFKPPFGEVVEIFNMM